MNTAQKIQIADDLRQFIARHDSANQVATMIDVSSATISHIINNKKWETINEKRWRKVAAGIRSYSDDLELAQTANLKLMHQALSDSQKFRWCVLITGKAGSGKTRAATEYARQNKNVFYVECDEFWTKTTLLKELLKACGQKPKGKQIGDLFNQLVEYVKSVETPLLLIDEADKLKDAVFYLLISLYNKLKKHAGIVFASTAYLKNRITRGVENERKGWDEIDSRLRRKPFELNPVSESDIRAICEANYITDEKLKTSIVNDSKSDLRRVESKIQVEHAKTLAAA